MPSFICHSIVWDDFVSVLALESQWKQSSTPSLWSLVVMKGRMRPVGDFLWLGSVLCKAAVLLWVPGLLDGFTTVVWVTRNGSGSKNLWYLFVKVFFPNEWKRKEENWVEPGQPGSLGKYLLEQRCWCGTGLNAEVVILRVFMCRRISYLTWQKSMALSMNWCSTSGHAGCISRLRNSVSSGGMSASASIS